MYTSNLITLLRTFSADEFRGFGKFISSPYYNTHRDVIRYYTFLKKYYPSFTGSGISRENIFAHIYPGRKFSDNEFQKLNSALNNLGSRYIMSRQERFNADFNLLNQFVERNLGKQFRALYKKVDYYLDKVEELDSMIFVKKIMLITLYIKFKMNSDSQKDVCGNIIERGNYFAYQSLMWLMIQSRDMRTNFNAFNFDYTSSNSNRFIESVDIEKVISGLEFEENRLGRYLKYYVYCILITLHPDVKEYYGYFKSSFEKIYNDVNKLEKSNYLSRLQSYVLKRAQAGDLSLLEELLDSYRRFFSSREIFEHGIIPMPPFRNSLMVSGCLKDIRFMEELTGKYSLYIYPGYSEDAKRYSYACLCFAKGEFGKVLESLSVISLSYAPFKIDVKNLLLKTFYELGYTDQLLDMVDSFRHFVSKNKTISGISAQRQLGMINSIKHLAITRTGTRKKRIENLKNEINDTELLFFDRIWLNKKIQELEGK